jgi:hypothetical protein
MNAQQPTSVSQADASIGLIFTIALILAVLFVYRPATSFPFRRSSVIRL